MAAHTADPGTVRFSIRSVMTVLVTCGLVVVGLGVAREFAIAALGTETPLRDLRHLALDSEHALPAYYSSLLLFVAALLLFVIGTLVRQSGKADHRRWLLLALIFMAMSVDEAVSFHEVLIEPLRNKLGLGGIFYFSWVIPGAAAVLALGLWFLPFLFRLPRTTAMLMMLSGGLFVGGALGLELLGGVYAEAQGMQSATYLAVAIAEETLEIAGITLFIAALLTHIRSAFSGAALRIETAGEPASGPYQRMLASRPVRTPELAPTH